MKWGLSKIETWRVLGSDNRERRSILTAFEGELRREEFGLNNGDGSEMREL